MTGRWSDLDRPPLDPRSLREALVGPGEVWRTLEVVDETVSTNADVARRAREGEPEGYVLLADHQSAGRGRLDRAWTAPPRSSVACSVLLRPGEPGERPTGVWPGVPPDRWSWLSLVAGLAVVDALQRVCGLEARLKWPNDVLVPVRDEGLRKVCGVLGEAVVTPDVLEGRPAAVVGVGINVSQTVAELPVATATSLRLAGSAVTDRDTVVRAYLRALAIRYARWRESAGDPRASGIAAGYREACVTIGRDVRVHRPGRGLLEGHVVGVDDDGRLIVDEPEDAGGGRHRLAAGDVEHLRTAEGTLG